MAGGSEAHWRRLQQMYPKAPCNEYFRPDFLHAAGAVHGSTLFKALDDAAFFVANSLLDGVFVLTVGFQLHFLRPVAGPTLRAAGVVVHRRRRPLVADAALRDEDGRKQARGTGSLMPGRTPLSAEIGYA